MIDSIRLFPLIEPSGYPQKVDATERRVEKKHEEYKAYLQNKKAQQELQDLQFEIYTKTYEQNKLRLEIFTNRKLDLLV
jgi:hypothetical protein